MNVVPTDPRAAHTTNSLTFGDVVRSLCDLSQDEAAARIDALLASGGIRFTNPKAAAAIQAFARCNGAPRKATALLRHERSSVVPAPSRAITATKRRSAS